MNLLAKSIRRAVAVPTVPRPLIIEIDPETSMIGFREKGAQRQYRLPIKTVFIMAINTDLGKRKEARMRKT